MGLVAPFATKELDFVFTPSLPGKFQETLTVENILDETNTQVSLPFVCKCLTCCQGHTFDPTTSSKSTMPCLNSCKQETCWSARDALQFLLSYAHFMCCDV